MTVSVSIGAVPAKLGEAVSAAAADAVRERGTFSLAISGGSLPRLLAEGLPPSAVDAAPAWRAFLADERVVPLHHADSNFRLIRHRLPRVPVEPIDASLPPAACAADYARRLARALGDAPRFDLLLLGLGPDGHTCSLFPAHPLLHEREKLVAAITDSPKPPPARVTLTYAVLNAARAVVFVVTGAAKAPVVQDILENEHSRLPGALVKPSHGTVTWLLDEDAASMLSK